MDIFSIPVYYKNAAEHIMMINPNNQVDFCPQGKLLLRRATIGEIGRSWAIHMLVTLITKNRNNIVHHSISLSSCADRLAGVTRGIKDFVKIVNYFLIKETIFISFVCLPGLDDVDNKPE